MTELWGVDVSSWQQPDAIPEGADFVIARASHGAAVDRKATEHVRRGRSLGARVGLYHFFTPDAPSATQADAFNRIADRCGLCAGDIIPFVDVEAVPVGSGWLQACEQWQPKLRAVTQRLAATWGSCGLYLNLGDFALLGSPEWLRELPLWLAAWCGAGREPATPLGVPWSLHQYRVGPYELGGGPGSLADVHSRTAIDHDRAHNLPLIAAANTQVGALTGRPNLVNLYEGSIEDMRAERDATVIDYGAPEYPPSCRLAAMLQRGAHA